MSATTTFNNNNTPAARIDILTATREEIADLDGIGPVLAERICSARESGGLLTWDDLQAIRGLGPVRLEGLQAQGVGVNPKASLRVARTADRAQNRRQYVPSAQAYCRKNGSMGFKRTLRAPGLADKVSEFMGWDQGPKPFVMSVIDRDGWLNNRALAKRMHWFELNRSWMINGDHPMYRYVNRCFGGQGVTWGAYGSGLFSPLVPGGFVPELDVELGTVVDHQGTTMGADGSGRVHPEHPIWEQLGLEQARVIQVRGLNEQGLFVKGILVPDVACTDDDGKPAIRFDWLQVKGALKERAKAHAGTEKTAKVTILMGVLKVWDHAGSIKTGFEWLENLANDPLTRQVVRDSIATKAMRVAKMDELQMARRFTMRGEPEHQAAEMLAAIGLNPLENKWVLERVLEQLTKWAFGLAFSAGISGSRYVSVLDATLEPGTCVVAGHEPGTLLGTYRFPIVSHTGLTRVRVVEPRKHHLVDGEPVPYAIYMAPQDLVDRLQGDDDGDEIAVLSDPKLVAAMGRTHSDTMVRIENHGGAKKELPMSNMSGIKYCSKKQLGPVGLYTWNRSAALASGNHRAAVLMSYWIQAAVDAPKKPVQWANIYRMDDPSAWTRHDDGSVEFTEFTDKPYGTRAWNRRQGIRSPRWWEFRNGLEYGVQSIERVEEILDVICPERNQEALANQDLVTYSAVAGLQAFKLVLGRVLPEEQGASTGSEALDDLLEQVMPSQRVSHERAVQELLGVEAITPWSEYLNGTRSQVLGQYLSRVSKLAGQEDREADWRHAREEFENNLRENPPNAQQLADLWFHELSRWWGEDEEANFSNPWAAAIVCCHPRGLVARMLGDEVSDECHFLDGVLDESVEWYFEKARELQEPVFDVLFRYIRQDWAHESETERPMHSCRDCQERLVIGALSKLRRAGSGAWKPAIEFIRAYNRLCWVKRTDSVRASTTKKK